MSGSLSKLSVLALCFAPACSPAEPEAPPPDIIVFVLDTMRADRMGCYGYERPTTPAIDAIAAQGTVFLDANAQAPWTKPSMVSMFTGRYLTAYRDIFEEEQPTLAETLKKGGYRTLGVVGNILLSEKTGFDRGFDHYDARRVPRAEREEEKARGLKPDLCRSADELAEHLWGPLNTALEPDASGSRPPLFVYVHPMDPHDPYRGFDQFEEELPLMGCPDPEPREWFETVFAERGASAPEDDPEWRKAWGRIRRGRGRYDQEVRFMDEEIGKMFARFRELGLLDNAIVAIVADHGEALWECVRLDTEENLATFGPDAFFHQEHGNFPFQRLIGTPFILWGAGIPQGLQVQTPVENVDLFPTLMELTGLPQPAGLHGASLVPLMAGDDSGWDKDVHCWSQTFLSLRDGQSGLKLVSPNALGQWFGRENEIWKPLQEPGEYTDFAQQHPAELERLVEQAEAWVKRYPTVNNVDYPKDLQTLKDLKALGYADE